MVFHHPIFFGQTLSRTFFFYHFLPVFVWLLVTSVKVVLQFAFDLQSDIDQPWYSPTSGILDLPIVFGIIFKFQVLFLLCVGVLITNTAFIRFMFDSLPIQQHPKMRKNFLAVVRGVQVATRHLGLARHLAVVCLRIGIFLVGLLPMFGCYYLYYIWRCDRCTWIDPTYLPYDDIFSSLLSSLSDEGSAASLLSANEPVASSNPFLMGTEKLPCPPRSIQEFHCDSVLKFSLIWILVVWQWVIVMISTTMRPHLFGKVRGSSSVDKAGKVKGPAPVRVAKISRGRSGSRASSPTSAAASARRAAEVEAMMEARKGRVFNGLEDVLCDDVNWDYVVGDACYAGMVLSSAYLIGGSFLSDRGMMYGVVTFLSVSSGQCFFYANVWFWLHLVTSLSDSIRYASRILSSVGSRIDFPSLPYIVAAAAVVFLSIVTKLTMIYYRNALVVLLILYCFGVIFPTITFWLFKIEERVLRKWPIFAPNRTPMASPSHTGMSPRMASSRSVSPLPNGSDLPQGMAVIKPITRRPISNNEGVSDSLDIPTRKNTGTGEETDTKLDSSEAHLVKDRPEPLSLDDSCGTEEANNNERSIKFDRHSNHHHQHIVADSAAIREEIHLYEDDEEGEEDEEAAMSARQSCAACLCCRGYNAPSDQLVSPNLRYKVYIGISWLLILLFIVIFGAVLQRVIVSDSATLPDIYYVKQHPPTETYSQAFSVNMDIRNHIFTSGTVLINKPTEDQESKNKVHNKKLRKESQDLNYCSHTVHSLSLTECALFTQLPYLPANSTDFDIFLHSLLPGFELVNRSSPASFSNRFSRSRVVFYELYSKERDISVITVRGTAAFEFSDWLADIDVWLEAATFQLFSKFLPGLSLWPATLRSQIIELINLAVDSFLPHERDPYFRHYYYPVLRHVQGMKSENIILVGHSLGGGVAKIVGAKTGHPAVSLAGPGIVDSRGKLGVTISEIDRHIVNLLPSGDIVSRIGKQGGTVVNVPCSDNRPDSCHCPMAVACELITSCGHPHIDMECRFHRHTSVPTSFYHTILNPKH